jgi:NAD(P)H-nitrite reductase large subunit
LECPPAQLGANGIARARAALARIIAASVSATAWGSLTRSNDGSGGIDSPAKLKLAAAGYPRNCSEALIKDVGFVAIGDGKWEFYIGGAGGSHVRKGDLMCTVNSEESAIALGGRFMQFYRENAKWRERTYDFVARIGIERIRAVIVEDCERRSRCGDAGFGRRRL